MSMHLFCNYATPFTSSLSLNTDDSCHGLELPGLVQQPLSKRHVLRTTTQRPSLRPPKSHPTPHSHAPNPHDHRRTPQKTWPRPTPKDRTPEEQAAHKALLAARAAKRLENPQIPGEKRGRGRPRKIRPEEAGAAPAAPTTVGQDLGNLLWLRMCM
ncbi:hypothetical protein BC829DRAFT_60946 [Chytridium lagenaria]|nr:hypothetical protein BC829DRAFT_60946 [Chytridium lagenaria]